MQNRFSQVTTTRDPLLEAWQKTLSKNGARAAIFDGHGEVARTFLEIEERATFFAGTLKSLAPGTVLAIQIGNHPDWPSLFLACLRKRIVVLPLEQTISDEQRRLAFEISRVKAAASSRAESRDPVEINLQVSPRDPSATLRFARDDKVDWRENQAALLKLTSGTTAAPRAIRFRSEQLLADCENICGTMEITERDLNFGVIPISHSYGFSNLLTPLLVCGVALALSNDRMPRAILDGISATRATVFPGMPVFYQALCEIPDAPPLPDLRLCISGGAPLTIELAEKFRAQFRREIHSFYGSSECGGICYVRKPKSIPGFVGRSMDGVEIESIEQKNASSVIRVRSRAVGDGYFPVPEPGKLGGGIFVPDDLLTNTSDGYCLVGRVSDLINVAGKKVNPAEIEAELLRFPGVLSAVVFGRVSERRNEEVAACVTVGPHVTENELVIYLRERLSSWQVPRRIYLVDSIPVNDRGKISRRQLARQFPANH